MYPWYRADYGKIYEADPIDVLAASVADTLTDGTATEAGVSEQHSALLDNGRRVCSKEYCIACCRGSHGGIFRESKMICVFYAVIVLLCMLVNMYINSL